MKSKNKRIFLLGVLIVLIIKCNLSFGQNKPVPNKLNSLSLNAEQYDFHEFKYQDFHMKENLTKLIYVVPLQAIVGNISGLLFFVAAYEITTPNLGGNLDHKDALFPFIAASIGYVAGISYGTYRIGNYFSLHGSFFPTLAGSIVGFLVGYYSVYSSSVVRFPVIIGTTTIGALAAYYIFRHPNENAFIKLSKNKINIGFPQFYLSQIGKIDPQITTNIEFLKISF